MLHAVILAGGGGTRFWPRSRKAHPKQFLKVMGDRTLLQATFDRIEAQVSPDRRWLLTAAAHRDEAARQLPHLAAERIVGEPTGRDTAAAIALGAALIARTDPDAVMLVMPADHVIEPVQEFHRAVHAAEQLALAHPEALITFGIPPTFPSTAYGYIQRGSVVETQQGVSVVSVRQYREKPDRATAEQFLASGEYYWNSGIFCWSVAAIRAELARLNPVLFAAVERIADAWARPQREQTLAEIYPTLEKQSIDKAVMEHAGTVFVLQAPFGWDDVGSWLALERLHPQDADGNTILTPHAGLRTENCVILGDSDRVITTIGVHDLIIIQDGDSLLIAHRSDEEAVKQLVQKLEQSPLKKHL